jgi:hypothetical protein
MAGKYLPLEAYLSAVPKSSRKIVLSFAEIEAILKFKLPSSAYEDGRWWEREKEGNHVNRRAWMNAGWKVAALDHKKKKVTFQRV